MLKYVAPLVSRTLLQWEVKDVWTQATGWLSNCIPLYDNFKQQLLAWWSSPAITQGGPLCPPQIKITLFTVASSHGWGAGMLNHKASGVWNAQERRLHIKNLQLLAVLLALDAL